MKRRLRLAYARWQSRVRPTEEAIARLAREELKCDKLISRREDFPALLDQIDGANPRDRLFVMGCGRSGTWLLYSLLAKQMDAYVLFEEVDVGRFARIRSNKPIHILKRNHKSYETAHRIPASVATVWIVRHPFDVLTSHHPVYGHKSFHIGPDRWNGEMDALRAFLATSRKNVAVLRYEDLVYDPEGTLARSMTSLGFEFSESKREFSDIEIPALVQRAMHGLRPVSRDSIERWRCHPEFRARLEEIMPLIDERLRWVSHSFGYDTQLPPG
jgi:hypothetical protein